MRLLSRYRGPLAFFVTLIVGGVLLGIGEGEAQQPRARRPPPVAKEAMPQAAEPEIKREQQPGARESVEADVSARNIAVTSSFNGTEIVIFGAIDGSQQPSPESGYYDVIIVVEGVPGRLVVRRKGNVAGLWLNTASAIFDNVPSYYAIASTRPIDEIVAGGVPGAARHRAAAPQVHAGRRPEGRHLHRGPQAVPRGHHPPEAQRPASTSTASTASPSPARASSAPASCCPPTSRSGRSTRASTCSARRSC